jgi:hypothetical protein
MPVTISNAMTYTTTAYLLSHEGNFSDASRMRGGGIIGPGGIGGIGALRCGLYVFWFSIIVLCFAVSDLLFSL